MGSRPALAARRAAERPSRPGDLVGQDEFEERGVAELLLAGQVEPFGQGVGHAAQLQGAQGAGQVDADGSDPEQAPAGAGRAEGPAVSAAVQAPQEQAQQKGRRAARGRKVAGGDPKRETVRPLRPAARGWFGRGAGAAGHVEAPDEWRGTTVQVCGLWPWVAGSGTPMVGVPLGRHITTGATLCCDPISWFQRAKLIGNPSVAVLALPARGKSTLVRRMAIGLAGYGTIPLVLGDRKPDYVATVKALDGQVISLGHGRGALNVLDPGESRGAAQRLREAGFEAQAQAIEADAHARRLTIVSALLTILRKQAPSDVEESIIDQALRVLAQSLARSGPRTQSPRAARGRPPPSRAPSMPRSLCAWCRRSPSGESAGTGVRSRCWADQVGGSAPSPRPGRRGCAPRSTRARTARRRRPHGTAVGRQESWCPGLRNSTPRRPRSSTTETR